MKLRKISDAKSETVDIDGFLNEIPSPKIDLDTLGVSLAHQKKGYFCGKTTNFE